MSKAAKEPDILLLPALRAQMGDWTYYISYMTMKDLTDHISPSQLVYGSAPMQDLLQRQLLKARRVDIQEYLIKQKQHFFNALVVATARGDPKWQELVVKDDLEVLGNPLPSPYAGNQGFLLLDKTAQLFTIDGQHRLEGIRKAIKEDPKLAKDEVAIIMVKGITGDSRKEDEEGFQRTRRLFSALNRYAKPVGQRDIIALDEDDVGAIVTRQLLNDYDLFTGDKIAARQTKSLEANNKSAVTSIVVLYQVISYYFGGITGPERRAWGRITRFRPTDDEIKEYYHKSEQFWNVYCRNFAPLKEVKDSTDEDAVPAKYRHENGGHVLFRPIGMLISARTVKALMSLEGLSLEKAVSAVSKVPVELDEAPWKDLIWDSVRKKMLYTVDRQRIAEQMMFHACGGDLTKMVDDADQVRRNLAGFIRVDDLTKFKLPKYV